MIDHEAMCCRALDEIKRVLALKRKDGVPFVNHFLFLMSVLHNQHRGTKGAGLTGGLEREKVWIEMLEAGSRTFRRKPPVGASPPPRDYDYYWESYPLSHKTIGWSGNGDLALAWSKNPAGGVQRKDFESSIVIVNSHRNTRRGNWAKVGMGVYLIPVPVLIERVTLKSNNKSDSIIGSDDVRACLRHAQDIGLYHAFTFNPEQGRSRYFSMWHASHDAIREQDH